MSNYVYAGEKVDTIICYEMKDKINDIYNFIKKYLLF